MKKLKPWKFWLILSVALFAVIVIIGVCFAPRSSYSEWDLERNVDSMNEAEDDGFSSINTLVNEQKHEIKAMVFEQAINEEDSELTDVSVIKFEKIDYIKDIRHYIDNNDLDKLSVVQKVSLAKSLQLCGKIPRYDEDAIEQKNNSIYFSGAEAEHYENWQSLVEMCNNVTEEEILKSYDMMVAAAMTGDFNAINHLSDVSPPDILKASMNNSWEGLDIERVRKDMVELQYPLLLESIEYGNVRGALSLAYDYQNGIMFEKDSIKALGYYLAAKEVLKTNKFNKIIEYVSQYLYDIEEAERSASELISKWNKFDEVYY